MATTLALSGERPAGLLDQFLAGARLRHPDGTVVPFEDDVWVTHPRARGKSVSFVGIAEWMKPLAKRVVAHSWLVEDKSHGTITSYAGALRKASEVLSHFEGPVEALNPDHAEHVREWAVSQWETRERALFDLGQKLGRELREKEIRSLARQEGTGLGEKSSRQVVNVLRKIVQAAEADGVRVDCRFTFPKLIGRTEVAVGSASSEKHLSSEQLASLIAAAMADIEEYQQLAAELHGEVRRYVTAANDPHTVLSGNSGAGKAARRLSRYFGLHGSPMESASQIAKDEGVAKAGFTRTLDSALVRAVGAEDADRLLKLRKKLARRWDDREEDENLIALRETIREYFDRHPLDFDLGEVSLAESSDAIVKLFGLNYPIHSAWDVELPSRGMVLARIQALAKLVHGGKAKRESRALWRRRGPLGNRLDRAIKACALLLQIVCYRRVSALIDSLSADLEGRWVEAPNGDRVFELDFTAEKMWGPRGLPETIPVPGYFGEVAETALRTAKELTAPLRSYAKPEHRNSLLLTRGHRNSWLDPTPILPSSLGDYLNNGVGRDGGGLLKRRDLKEVKHVTLHFFRHTAATTMLTAGGSAISVADLLGNTPEMAAKFYFTGGSEEERDQAKAAAERDSTTGFLTDAVVRVAKGPEADGEYPSQLPYDVALKRIRDTPEFVQDFLDLDGAFGPEQARAMLESGLMINITRFGGCVLPTEEGHCPAVHSCPVGCDPSRNQEDPNCGCRWGVKIPHTEAISTYESELAIMKAQREEMAGQSRFAAFAGPLEKKIQIHETQLETLYHLREATADVGA